MVLTGTQKEMVWMILEDQGNHLIQSKAKFVFFCVSFRAVHALSRETGSTCIVQRNTKTPNEDHIKIIYQNETNHCILPLWRPGNKVSPSTTDKK